MVDATTLKLGKGPVKHDPRTLRAANYMKAVTPPPSSVDWQSSVPRWGMFKNDTVGCCVFATMGHYTQEWTFDASGNEVTVSDSDIINAYSAVTGYNPKDPNTDQGAVEIDGLNYWRNTGVAGHKIAAYVKLDPHNHDQIKQAINTFGGVYIGLALPVSAQNQIANGQVWDVTNGPDAAAGSWGGHAVHAGAYDQNTLEVITWAQRQKMTWAFWDAYVDEAYAVLGEDWLNGGKSPQGFDIAALQADLAAIHNNQPNPTPAPVPPTPTPTPVPPGPTPEPPIPSSLVVNITDSKVASRILKIATRAKITPDDYVTRHFKRYFRFF